jgi:uncharacterized damage-inducible protein DinB
MNPQMTAPNETMTLNTRLFVNCLDGVDDDAARKRLSEETNSLAFIAAHLVGARHFLLSDLGVKTGKPFGGLLDTVSNIDNVREYPSIQDIRSAWDDVTTRLEQRFTELTDSDLKEESKNPFPVNNRTVLGGITFLMQHEAYHIGQLAFLRKHLGLGSMSYS